MRLICPNVYTLVASRQLRYSNHERTRRVTTASVGATTYSIKQATTILVNLYLLIYLVEPTRKASRRQTQGNKYISSKDTRTTDANSIDISTEDASAGTSTQD